MINTVVADSIPFDNTGTTLVSEDVRSAIIEASTMGGSGGPHASTHLPSGSDPLATGVPSNTGTANAEGTAEAFARQDHVHNTVIHTQNVFASTATSTTSATAALLNAMTLTPTISGDYLITATAIARHQGGGGRIDFSIYINGTQLTTSLGQCYTDRADQSVTYSITIKQTLTSGQAVEIRWLRTATGTATASARSLTLTKVG
jgi:hypothetical protein